MEKQITDKEKTTALAFLKWVSKSCTARNTSRNNIWSNYWMLNSTGVLYSADELYDYWNVNVKNYA